MRRRSFLTLAGLTISCSAVLLYAEEDPSREARDASRAVEWRVPDIVRALDIRPGSRIADIGCGDGFLTIPLAAAVGPEGRVFAVDIDERALAALRKRVDGTANVEVIRGEDADPRLAPLSIDGAVILRAYHEFVNHRDMLAAIREALKPGARVVIADVGPNDIRSARLNQVAQHVLARQIAESELKEAGFRVVLSDPSFVRLHDGETGWLIAAERPPAHS